MAVMDSLARKPRGSAGTIARLEQNLKAASKKPTSTRKQAVTKQESQPKSEVSRELILQAAARLFRDQGYSATTLRQIADKAGMKAGSIYYHFDSKTTILEEVLRLGLQRIYDSVKSSVGALGNKASHRSRITTAIEAHLVSLLEISDYTSANIRIYGQLPESIKKRHRPLRRAYGKFWDQMLLDAQRDGEIRPDVLIVPLRRFILGALNWTVEWFDARKSSSVSDLAIRTAMLIFDGVRKR